MTHLITGLSGFVGSHCADRLPQARGLVLDGKAIDIRDRGGVLAAVDALRPERVIHLAAQSFVPTSFDNPAETIEINVLGTLNLLQALRETGFKGRFLFVGTADLYGAVPEAELPVDEERALRPRNPYAVSKVAAEALCYQWSQTEKFDVVMARPFNHIGPRQAPHFAASDFARQIVRISLGQAAPELVVGDIDVTRDFTDVRDVVRAYESLLDHGRSGEVYNVCSGVEHSLRDLVDSLQRLAGIDCRLVTDPARMRKAEQRRMRGSAAKLKTATGWTPSIEFDRTLQDMLTHWTSKEKK